MPGELIEIPQASVTYRFIAHYYSNYEGFPPPLTNGGLNEYQVAARDIWSPSRPELVEMTDPVQRGLNYSDLARIVMERAMTAEQAVDIIGKLIDEHGFATYGGNSHLFADPREGWVFINFAGSTSTSQTSRSSATRSTRLRPTSSLSQSSRAGTIRTPAMTST
jgi:dipeptidase